MSAGNAFACTHRETQLDWRSSLNLECSLNIDTRLSRRTDWIARPMVNGILDEAAPLQCMSAADVDALPAPTVAKTMAIIETVGKYPEGLTQSEVVQLTGCSANLVYRALSTLVTLGYITRQDDDRRYLLTGRLLESSQPRPNDKSLVICAHSAMLWLREQTRETVQLMIAVNQKGIVIEQLSGLEALQVMGRVGMQVPLYSCAPGKAILAHWSEESLDQWFTKVPLKSFTPNTKTTRSALLDDLEQVRRRGYSEDREEGIEGIRCVAAPILDAHRRPVGAITVMSPAKRLPQRRFTEIGNWCMQAAARIRGELLS